MANRFSRSEPKRTRYLDLPVDMPEDLMAAIMILIQLRKDRVRGEITFRFSGNGLIKNWKITQCEEINNFVLTGDNKRVY